MSKRMKCGQYLSTFNHSSMLDVATSDSLKSGASSGTSIDVNFDVKRTAQENQQT